MPADKRAWASLIASYALLVAVAVTILTTKRGVVPMSTLALAPLMAAVRSSPVQVLLLGAASTGVGTVIARIQLDLPVPDAASRLAFLVAASLLAAHVANLRMKSERLSVQLRELANTDALTGLSSRRAVLDTAEQMAAVRPQHRSPLSVALLDLDRFKTINDTLGHQAGDDVLAEVARRVRDSLRGGDLAGRYGGEELLVVLPGDGEPGARTAVQRLLDTIAKEPVVTREGPVRVTASAGLAVIDGQETGLEDAIARADAALYRAKAAGRNRLASAEKSG